MPATQPLQNRIWRKFKRVALTLFVILFVALGALFLAVRWGGLPNYLKKKMIENYVKKVEPHLPFKIESVEVDESWQRLWKGEVSNLSLVLRWQGTKIFLTGPIDIDRNGKTGELTVAYTPEIALELMAKPGIRSTSLPFNLSLKVAENFSQLRGLTVDARSKTWEWKIFGIDTLDPEFHFAWDGSEARLNFSAKLFHWNSPANTGATEDRELRLENPELLVNSTMGLQPFRLETPIVAQFKTKKIESLWGSHYLNLPLGALNFRTQISRALTNQPEGSLQISADADPLLAIQAKMSRKGSSVESLAIDWRSKVFSLEKLMKSLRALLPDNPDLAKLLAPLKPVHFRGGTVQSRGNWRYDPHSKFSELETELELHRAALELPEVQSAIQGLELALKYRSSEGLRGQLAIPELYYRHFVAHLASTPLSFLPAPKNPNRFSIRIGGARLPLRVENLNLDLGGFSGFVTPGADTLHFEVTTSLKIPRVELKSLAPSLCLNAVKIPPATLQLDFPKILFSEDLIEPIGKLELAAFGGVFEIDQLSLADYRTPVPQLDFDVHGEGFRLNEIGDWTGFGEMDGIVSAHAHDVTFQSWLPTHYNFLLKLEKYRKKKIVFSGEAMRNLVQLIAPGQADALPGIADWFVFGLFKKLFGGYDIDYGGISLYSSDGAILLETLDPESSFDAATGDLVKSQKHYILYGKSFKMPINNSHYPIVLDAASMSNHVKNWVDAVEEMIAAKAEKRRIEALAKKTKTRSKVEEKEIINDESSARCLPPQL